MESSIIIIQTDFSSDPDKVQWICLNRQGSAPLLAQGDIEIDWVGIVRGAGVSEMTMAEVAHRRAALAAMEELAPNRRVYFDKPTSPFAGRVYHVFDVEGE